MEISKFERGEGGGHCSLMSDEEQKKLTRWASVQLCEEDYMMMEEAFRPAIKRCDKNAAACINNGYGSGDSLQKAENWKQKAWRMQELLNRVAIEMT
jgi:hypothetical protein